MVVQISEYPFADQDAFEFDILLGPAWFIIDGPYIRTDIRVAGYLQSFLEAAYQLTDRSYDYGTVYAASHTEARTCGDRHYDLGEYTAGGTERFVSTWHEFDRECGNVFILPHGERLQAPNRYVTRFHEGSDYHFHPAASGKRLFLSASFYCEGEPANLDCPRLADLRSRGTYAELAKLHRSVTRSVY